MSTGRNALHRIDASIAEARHSLSRANDTAAQDVQAIAHIEQRELEIYRGLADLRLETLISGETPAPVFGDADQRAAQLIDQHENRIAALAAERDAAQAEIENLEAQRRDAEAALEAAITRHDEAAADTREALDKDPDYQARATALEEANAVASRAAQKLELAGADRKEKGAPYEADPLFMYLWNRKFGTREYRAFPLFAILDRWVAGLIKYRDHKLNYARLLELPERLKEHATRVDAASSKMTSTSRGGDAPRLRRRAAKLIAASANILSRSAGLDLELESPSGSVPPFSALLSACSRATSIL